MLRAPLFAALSLALAAPASAEPKPRLVVTGVNAADPALKPLAEAVSEQLLTELGGSKSFVVSGPSDLAVLLGLERQKMLAGCGESSASCLAELGAALGAKWAVMGNLARAGKTTRIDLKMLQTSDGQALWRGGRSFDDDSEMFRVVTAMAKELAAFMAPGEPASASPPVRVAPLVLVIGGAVATVAGGALAGLTWSDAKTYANPAYAWPSGTTVAQVRQRQASANGTIAAGSVVGAVGLAALAGGVVWWLTGAPGGAAPPVALVPTFDGVAVSGAF